MVIISNVDKFQPSFIRFPINDNTTGYKPLSMPMILVVPRRIDEVGALVPDSDVFLTKKDLSSGSTYQVPGVRMLLENVPSQALIVGHQYRDKNGNQIRYPDRELYSKEVLADNFENLRIDLNRDDIKYFKLDAKGDIQAYVTKSEAVEGDYFTYRTISGVEASLLYLPSAFYYDISELKIDDMLTLPDNYYNLVYETQYYRRNVINAGKLTQYICVDISSIELAFNSLRVNHPGQILSEFTRLTPPPYLNEKPYDEDETVAFYRPFTTALQDIYDEQVLLEVVSWIYETPAELLPYLAYQLGWDLPFFPQSLDRQRRAVLRKITSLQQLKGSKQAVVTIFNLFGFDVLLSNLWWSLDSKRLIRPNEMLPTEYENQEIVEALNVQFETVVGAVSGDSPDLPNQIVYYRYDISTNQRFLAYNSNFLFRPKSVVDAEGETQLTDGGSVFLYGIKVTKGSPADIILQGITNSVNDDPVDFGINHNIIEDGDVLTPKFLYDALEGQSVLGISIVQMTGNRSTLVKISNLGFNAPFASTPISGTSNIVNNSIGYDNIFVPDNYTNVRFDRLSNRLSFTFESPISNDEVVYVYAAYRKAVYIMSPDMMNRRSNYFDLELFLSGTTEQLNPITLNYAIDFLNRVKAMHSILRTIRQRINLNEDYEVTDLSVGGDVLQRPNTDLGMLQVPPAILPGGGSGIECFDYSPRNLGYKQADIDLRNIKIERLESEFLASESLDRIPFSATIERILPNVPANTGNDFYTPYNQDRVITSTRDSRLVIDGVRREPRPNSNQLSGQPSDPINPFPGDDILLGDLKKYRELTTNSDSSMVIKMLSQESAPGETLKQVDNITDFSYKGRVADTLLYSQVPTFGEQFRSVMCGLRLGSGTYYSYPYRSEPANPGTRNPAQNSKTNYLIFSGNSPVEGVEYFKYGLEKTYFDQPLNYPQAYQYADLLGKIYRAYPNSNNESTIHYFNCQKTFEYDQKYNLALTRPNIDIIKPTLHLPGCRFPTLNRLKNDYENTSYRARPWDDAYSTYCGQRGSCGNKEPSFLNVKQIPGTDGNTSISFDDRPCMVYGNNIEEDIPTLTTYTGSNDTNIIHKVYMGDADSNPAVSFEQVCPFDSNVSSEGYISTNDPIFPYVTGDQDYADGYPCVFGIQNVDVTVNYTYNDAILLLGVPQDITGYTTVLFLLGSGMLNELGVRLSCPSQNEQYNNDFTLFINQNGDLQTDPDILYVSAPMSLEERLSISNLYLDGSIPSLLETVL